MPQTREAITQNLTERLCWEAARRDDLRKARRLYQKQVVDGIYRLDEGAVLDEFFHFLQGLCVLELMSEVRGTAIEREMVLCVQDVLLYGLKALLGVESMHVLPPLFFSDEALMRLVGFNAHQVRLGVCQRGAAKRQNPRKVGPICPETLANIMVQLNLRALGALFNSSIQALA